MIESQTKADLIEDKCPRCGGTRFDPGQPPIPLRPLPDNPISGEQQFEIGAVRCRQCNGTGRIPKGK